MLMFDEPVIKSVVAGLIASVACGLGVLPLFWRRVNVQKHTGLAYAFSGGLMFAASVYNLILPGLTMDSELMSLRRVSLVLAGILLGALVLWRADVLLSRINPKGESVRRWGGRAGLLIFLAMMIHSIPEGVAVGVGYASEEVFASKGAYGERLGSYIAIAIGVHNIPEGLAVAIPLRAANVSLRNCFFAAFLTSLPQPIAAIPACIVSGLFDPIMPVLMGFAAGAMIFLVMLELIPDALDTIKPARMAWGFTFGFCAMLLIQVIL